MTLNIGQRVRTLIHFESVSWAPEQPDIAAGELGTIDYIHFAHNDPTTVSGYGVMLDDSVERLAVWIDPADLEAVTD